MTALAYRQEILADETDEVPGALWTRAVLTGSRVALEKLPDLTRIAIGVDPPGGATECGIIAAGVAMCACKGKFKDELHAFVFEDASLKAPPDVWSRVIDTVYQERQADLVVAEKNYGGDMVRFTVMTANSQIHFKDVQATRGKAVRAEPVSALYEQGKVHHVGLLKAAADKAAGMLEDEMCSWVPNLGMSSPNRLDALVWVLTELMLKPYSPLKHGAIAGTPRTSVLPRAASPSRRSF